MAVTKRLRFAVLERDGHACIYCGRKPPEVKLTVDHVVAIALGGSDEPGNLAAACADCNSGKTTLPADGPRVAQVAEYAVRWKAAVQSAGGRAASDIEFEGIRRGAITEALKKSWGGYTTTGNGQRVPSGSFDPIVEAYFVAGVEEDHTRTILLESIRIGMERHGVEPDARWAYFHGVAWTKLRQINEEASVDLGEGDEAGRVREVYPGQLAESEERTQYLNDALANALDLTEILWGGIWIAAATHHDCPMRELGFPDAAAVSGSAIRLRLLCESAVPSDLWATIRQFIREKCTAPEILDMMGAPKLTRYRIGCIDANGPDTEYAEYPDPDLESY